MNTQTEQSLSTMRDVIDRAIKHGVFNNMDEALAVINAYNNIVAICNEYFKKNAVTS